MMEPTSLSDAAVAATHNRNENHSLSELQTLTSLTVVDADENAPYQFTPQHQPLDETVNGDDRMGRRDPPPSAILPLALIARMAGETLAVWITGYLLLALLFSSWKWDLYGEETVHRIDSTNTLHVSSNESESLSMAPTQIDAKFEALLLIAVQKKSRMRDFDQQARTVDRAAQRLIRRDAARQALEQRRRTQENFWRAMRASRNVARAARQRERLANQTVERAQWLERQATRDAEVKAIGEMYPMLLDIAELAKDSSFALKSATQAATIENLTNDLQTLVATIQLKKRDMLTERQSLVRRKYELVKAINSSLLERKHSNDDQLSTSTVDAFPLTFTLGALPSNGTFFEGRGLHSNVSSNSLYELTQFVDVLQTMSSLASDTNVSLTHLIGLMHSDTERHILNSGEVAWSEITRRFRKHGTSHQGRNRLSWPDKDMTNNVNYCSNLSALVNRSYFEDCFVGLKAWYTHYVRHAADTAPDDVNDNTNRSSRSASLLHFPALTATSRTRLYADLEEAMHEEILMIGQQQTDSEIDTISHKRCLKSSEVLPWVEAGLEGLSKFGDPTTYQKIDLRFDILQQLQKEGRDTSLLILDAALPDDGLGNDKAGSSRALRPVTLRQLLNNPYVAHSLPSFLEQLVQVMGGHNDHIDTIFDQIVVRASDLVKRSNGIADEATPFPHTAGEALAIAALEVVGHIPPILIPNWILQQFKFMLPYDYERLV